MSKNKQVEGQLDFFALLSFEEGEKESSKLNSISELAPFEECNSCWCRDCRHNEQNEAVPREFAGQMRACPSCNLCIENDEPDICVIGSYKNGCKLRAEEEGFGPDT